MSGYIGNPDAESEHAMILSENAVHAVQQHLALQRMRPSAKTCKDEDCGVEIPEIRRQLVPGVQFCVHCAPKHQVRQQRIKMLDRIL